MASYREGVQWIAEKHPAVTELDALASLNATLLLAHLWKEEPERVARDVVKHRQEGKRVRCSAVSDGERCVLREGHRGNHIDDFGEPWADADEKKAEAS